MESDLPSKGDSKIKFITNSYCKIYNKVLEQFTLKTNSL